MARIIRTLADGSQPSTFLNQSRIGVPLQTGVIRETQSGLLYGYSGEIDFDVTAAASYQMITFSLDRDSIFKVHFSALYKILQSVNGGYGYDISIDGNTIWNFSTDTSGGRNGGPNAADTEILIPARKDVIINVLNPDATASLLKATVVLIGEYI